MDEFQTSPIMQFKTRLSILTAIDLAMGVALFLLSLYLLDDYLLHVQIRTPIITAILAVFALCFITDPVMSLAVLIRHTQGDAMDEIGMLRKWLKMCNGFVIFVVPEMFFFLTFYSFFPITSCVGFVMCVCKLVIYYHKVTLVSNYLEQRQLTTNYYNGSRSITPEVPSYGAFGPPTYEEAIKNKEIYPLEDEKYYSSSGEKDT